MRTTRVLAIAAILGIAFSFRASAKVVYDSETTNKWFDAEVATSSTLTSNWTPPSKGGEAVVKGGSDAHYIALDTDLDDPLTYTATDASADVAVVAATMTATVNATAPQIDSNPQAALAVVGNGTAINWVGLVGTESGGTEWVTFPSPVPVAGNPYSVRIEFDQRATKKIRYLVNGVVLSGAGSTDGWYPNPQAGAAKIRNVSFSGSGDIRALAGKNITENTIAFNAPTQTNGFDYTNGAISVSAAIQGYTGVTATLTVTGTDGQKVKVVPQTPGSANWSWALNDLTQGGAYAYTIEAKDAGGNVIATKTGTFTAAKWGDDIWFGADASKAEGSRETGGSWDSTKKPAAVEDNAYVIEDDALFNVTDQKPGSNHVTRVDTIVTFETLVDSNALEAETDALGGFVVAKSGETPQWMALTKNGTVQWVVLSGDVEPEVNVPYVIRAEVDSISESKCVRYFVSKDDGVNFVPLTSDGTPWIAFADASKGSLAKVELKGSGKVAKFEAKVADKALAKVGNTEYDTMEEALAAAKDGTESITLLTNATVEPKEKGSYDIAPGAYQYVSEGKVSTEPRTIVITKQGQPPVVRPSNQVMTDVRTPSNKPYKNINSLREFLERNAPAYRNENATSQDIENALNAPQTGDGKNGLELWKDFALGIDPTNSVAPVTIPTGDTNPNKITLAIPAVDPKNYSGDYDIKYQVTDGTTSVDQEGPGKILIPLEHGTGTYTIKAVFDPAK